MSELSKKCHNCGGEIDVNPLEDKTICSYCGASYVTSDLLNESEAIRLEKIRTKAQKEAEERKIADARRQQIIKKEEKEAKHFLKSPFRFVLIVFTFFALLFCVMCFKKERVLAGLVSIVDIAAFIFAYLLYGNIIKPKFRGMRTIFCIIAFVLIFPVLTLYQKHYSESDFQTKEAIVWSTIIMKDELPTPEKLYGEVHINSEKSLMVDVEVSSTQEYQKYVDQCKEKGYVVEPEILDDDYEAFNESGYKISIHYSDILSKEISIFLDAPDKLENITWPTYDMVKTLPVPNSQIGKIHSEESDSFVVDIGETSLEDYKKYVEKCQKAGYNKNFSKHETSFDAENDQGYSLEVTYEGFNIMEIDLSIGE